jgi:hypothetical protein
MYLLTRILIEYSIIFQHPQLTPYVQIVSVTHTVSGDVLFGLAFTAFKTYEKQSKLMGISDM